jgi:preprotein translocase SecF subunit
MLSLLGFSVNDTIVIFDRFRSEWLGRGQAGLREVLDRAVKASLVRSLNIAFAVLLVLGALFFFGGETIRWFVVALIAGTLVGTYSSLFVAPPVLYYLAKR